MASTAGDHFDIDDASHQTEVLLRSCGCHSICLDFQAASLLVSRTSEDIVADESSPEAEPSNAVSRPSRRTRDTHRHTHTQITNVQLQT